MLYTFISFYFWSLQSFPVYFPVTPFYASHTVRSKWLCSMLYSWDVKVIVTYHATTFIQIIIISHHISILINNHKYRKPIQCKSNEVCSSALVRNSDLSWCDDSGKAAWIGLSTWTHWTWIGMPVIPTKQNVMSISLGSGLVWSGLVWSGLVWSGLVWSGLVWCASGSWSGFESGSMGQGLHKFCHDVHKRYAINVSSSQNWL